MNIKIKQTELSPLGELLWKSMVTQEDREAQETLRLGIIVLEHLLSQKKRQFKIHGLHKIIRTVYINDIHTAIRLASFRNARIENKRAGKGPVLKENLAPLVKRRVEILLESLPEVLEYLLKDAGLDARALTQSVLTHLREILQQYAEIIQLVRAEKPSCNMEAKGYAARLEEDQTRLRGFQEPPCYARIQQFQKAIAEIEGPIGTPLTALRPELLNETEGA